MKMKEFGPPGGARVPGAPPWIRQWLSIKFCTENQDIYCMYKICMDILGINFLVFKRDKNVFKIVASICG